MSKKKTEAKGELASAPKPDDKWQIEDDLRTLMRAEEIKGDSERMKKVHKLAGRQHKAIKSIRDLRDIANEKAMEKHREEAMDLDE